MVEGCRNFEFINWDTLKGSKLREEGGTSEEWEVQKKAWRDRGEKVVWASRQCM